MGRIRKFAVEMTRRGQPWRIPNRTFPGAWKPASNAGSHIPTAMATAGCLAATKPNPAKIGASYRFLHRTGFINLANGNLHLEIPLAAPPQRGSLGLSEKLIYDSRIWRIVGGAWQPTNVANSQGGWRFVTTADLGSVGYAYELEFCDPSGTANNYSNFTWTEPNGTIHYFGISTRSSQSLNCKGPKPSSGNGFGSDSSG